MGETLSIHVTWSNSYRNSSLQIGSAIRRGQTVLGGDDKPGFQGEVSGFSALAIHGHVTMPAPCLYRKAQVPRNTGQYQFVKVQRNCSRNYKRCK